VKKGSKAVLGVRREEEEESEEEEWEEVLNCLLVVRDSFILPLPLPLPPSFSSTQCKPPRNAKH
jgi:hypothetical protein